MSEVKLRAGEDVCYPTGSARPGDQPMARPPLGRDSAKRRPDNDEIDARYRRAYEDGTGLGFELEGWEDEGSWPED